ncbi:MAG: hypothetical protein V7641_4115 [Blastocatellia bacterium]
MKSSLRIPHWIALLLLIWTAACSASPENNNATSNNDAAPAAQTADLPSVTAQQATPLATATPPVASPAPTPATSAPTATKPATETAANPATKAAEAHVNGPKLVVVSQEKDLDFGKQPQDKTLVKPIRIKNGGSITLNIESVSPS